MLLDRKAILFLEDEKFLLDTYQDFCIQKRHFFFGTSDVKEALAIVREDDIDVVLLDILIPAANAESGFSAIDEQGYEFLKEMRKDPSLNHIPVIMFTNLDTEEDRRRAKAFGADAYVVKCDVTPQQLMEKVEEVIAAKKAQFPRKF